MSVASRTLSADTPAATRLFALLYRGLMRAVSTIALWCRRAHDRRQLAIIESIVPELPSRHWYRVHRSGFVAPRLGTEEPKTRSQAMSAAGPGPNDDAFENGFWSGPYRRQFPMSVEVEESGECKVTHASCQSIDSYNAFRSGLSGDGADGRNGRTLAPPGQPAPAARAAVKHIAPRFPS